jgi:RNA-binding protein
MLLKIQIKHLRKLTHDLNPIIMLGQNGFTEAVLNELNIALEHHELVKIKLSGGDRDQRNQQIADICKQSHSEEIQSIGKTVTIYRRNKNNPVIELPTK